MYMYVFSLFFICSVVHTNKSAHMDFTLTKIHRTPLRLPPRAVRTMRLARSLRTRLAPRAPRALCRVPLRLPLRAVRPYTSRLARSLQTRLTPRAPRALHLVPCTPLVPHATRRPRLALRSPVPRQLASIGLHQVDEHTLQPYVSYV